VFQSAGGPDEIELAVEFGADRVHVRELEPNPFVHWRVIAQASRQLTLTDSLCHHFMTAADLLIQELAPTGRLRASINLGNPILASRDATTGQPKGVSIDLACEFSARLGMPLELLVFDTAAKSVDAVSAGHFSRSTPSAASTSCSPRPMC
jgi:hypothetical protein